MGAEGFSLIKCITGILKGIHLSHLSHGCWRVFSYQMYHRGTEGYSLIKCITGVLKDIHLSHLSHGCWKVFTYHTYGVMKDIQFSYFSHECWRIFTYYSYGGIEGFSLTTLMGVLEGFHLSHLSEGWWRVFTYHTYGGPEWFSLITFWMKKDVFLKYYDVIVAQHFYLKISRTFSFTGLKHYFAHFMRKLLNTLYFSFYNHSEHTEFFVTVLKFCQFYYMCIID